MRAYGHDRKDKLECRYGCCTFKGGKMLVCRAVVDKTRRKRARREKEPFNSLSGWSDIIVKD